MWRLSHSRSFIKQCHLTRHVLCTCTNIAVLLITRTHILVDPVMTMLCAPNTGTIKQCDNGLGTLQLPTYRDFKVLQNWNEAHRICHDFKQAIPTYSLQMRTCVNQMQKKMQERIDTGKDIPVWFDIDNNDYWRKLRQHRYVLCFVCKFDCATISCKWVYRR